jgi:hypothetical protein
MSYRAEEFIATVELAAEILNNLRSSCDGLAAFFFLTLH